MITRPSQTVTASLLVLTLGLAAGCQPKAATDTEAEHGHSHGHGHAHEHGDRPTTLTAAVAQLVEVRDEVRAAMSSGSPNDAHHPLHEVGDLLEALPEIASDTDLPREKWEEAKAETDKLFDAFGVIDKAFHVADGDKQAAYEQVASEIDASIARLQALLPLAGEHVPEAGGDHDGDHSHDDGHDH